MTPTPNRTHDETFALVTPWRGHYFTDDKGLWVPSDVLKAALSLTHFTSYDMRNSTQMNAVEARRFGDALVKLLDRIALNGPALPPPNRFAPNQPGVAVPGSKAWCEGILAGNLEIARNLCHMAALGGGLQWEERVVANADTRRR